MGFGKPRAFARVSILVAGLATMAGAPAQQASAKAPKAAAKARAGAAGFSIERPPAWVQPLAWDPATPIAPASYQILVSDEQVRVQPGGNADYRHYIRRINDAAGLAAGGQIEIEFDPSYQKLVLHQVDILRGTQRIAKLDPRQVKLLHRETQLERQVVDGRMTASLVLDDLRVGDRVEWSASIVGDNPVFGGRFVDSNWTEYANGPTGQWQLRLLAPAARSIRTRVTDAAVETSGTQHDGLRDTVFRRRNLPQLQFEERLPPAQYLKYQVDASEFADWQDVAQWAAQLFARAMQPTPAVDAQVAALKARAATAGTPDALLRATLDFVQKDIRYFGTEIGADSHQPADADTVLRQRFGDCKDKAALLATLLTRMGFDASPVLVSANFRDAAAQRLPSALAFDHAIVRVVVDGRPLWLDATRSQQTGAVAERQARDLGVGLVARADTTALAALPDSRDQVHLETVDTFAFPRMAEEGTLTSVTTLHDDAAEWLRAALASQPADQVEKAVTAETLRAYPSLVPAGPSEFVTESEDNTVRVTSRYRTGDFWTFPEQRGLAGHFALYTVVAPLRLPDQPARTRPFALPGAGRYLHKTVFDLGEETPAQANTTRFDETNKQFGLHVQYETQPRHHEIRGELRQLVPAVEAADWPVYRDKVTRLAARLGGPIVISALGPAQSQELRAEGTAMVDDMRHGRQRVVIKEEATARMHLLLLDKELAAGRLPPKLRAQALTAKGIQLDTLGREHEAEPFFKESIALDDGSAEAHEALAVNAFQRRQDAEAGDQVDATLRLAPANTQVRYIHAWTRYFAGDAAAAGTEFADLLQSQAEVDRSYGVIWLYLATRLAGGDASAAVKPYAAGSSSPEWPYPVLQMMKGEIDLDAALAASRENGQPNAGRECELHFFAGEKALADGDAGMARAEFRKSVATDVRGYTEYNMAMRELSKLDANQVLRSPGRAARQAPASAP